jgi:hypothetical protein
MIKVNFAVFALPTAEIEITALWLKAAYVLNIAAAADGTGNATLLNTRNNVIF